MDQESQKQLAVIVSKDVNDLTESDVAFLRARRSYLTEEQCANFARVLADGTGTTIVPNSAPSPEASEAPEAPAGRKRK